LLRHLRDVRQTATKYIGNDSAATAFSNDARDQFVTGCVGVVYGYSRESVFETPAG
jgi:hypothetical protein